jgi:hypothetical protein
MPAPLIDAITASRVAVDPRGSATAAVYSQ